MDSRRPALDHLPALERLTAAFTDALAGADLDAAVGGMSRWRVRDVGTHLLVIHRWAAEVVRTGHRPPRTDGVPVPDDELVPRYREAAAELLQVLRSTDPERGCWTLDRTDRRVGGWPRRQVHETAVHLWDVRSPADATPSALADVPAVWCADGVDEMLQLTPSRLGRDRRPLPGPMSLHATDVDRHWLLAPDWLLTPDPASAPDRPGGGDLEPVATIRAPARDLLLHVWGRGRFAEVDGDPATLEAFDRAPCRG